MRRVPRREPPKAPLPRRRADAVRSWSFRSQRPRTACSARSTWGTRSRPGERGFEPGLLARANRGILYVDEVNLLDDHLVDALLDVAASGVNTVEREGIAYSHPARFVLIGTMNPEEGELRPQLLDRFGLAVSVEGLSRAEDRVEVVRRRSLYEADPGGIPRGMGSCRGGARRVRWRSRASGRPS